MSAKVYVVQDDGRKNLMPAMQFGHLVAVAQQDLPLFSDATREVNRIRKELIPFDHENDFLLVIGDPLLIGVCFALLLRDHPYIKVLKWDKQNRTYFPTVVGI